MKRISKLHAYAQLGVINILRVGLYRLGLKSGLHPVLRVKGRVAQGPFFRMRARVEELPPPNAAWDDSIWRFGWHHRPLSDEPPDWFANPFSDQVQPDAERDWWHIPDFAAGDIKGVWELSRMDWAVAWATKASHGDAQALCRLNAWLDSWAQSNPPYKGPNWKCGQEASIRVMHLVVAAWVLGQDRDPEAGLVNFLIAHVQRIAPTMSYAIAQQNNHGTSEAAALFMGGCLLEGRDKRAAIWARKGLRWLEERAHSLIESDGSFSQYSVTYHRVALDTYSIAEAWRRHRDLPPFSDGLYRRLAAATRWLEAMTLAETGDAPNIGANDGTRLVPLSDSDYRDFRPSVQLAAALFEGRDAYGKGPWNHPMRWLGVTPGQDGTASRSTTFDEGGYHVLRLGCSMAVLRYPRFRFRPSQADALHLDFWLDGENLLRDAGSYSYNAQSTEWFSGTSAHNTVSFDKRDQMPRLGRFLFGEWLRAESVEKVQVHDEVVSAAAAYRDVRGASHHRRIVLRRNVLTCFDTLAGGFQHASLRWRLAPGEWILDDRTVRGPGLTIQMEADAAPISVRVTTTWESRHYLKRCEIPVLEIELCRPATIVTRFTF